MLRFPRLSSSNTGLTSRSPPSMRWKVRRITARRFDLHDVGAPVGEDAGGTGSGHPDAELDHPHPLERTGPGCVVSVVPRRI